MLHSRRALVLLPMLLCHCRLSLAWVQRTTLQHHPLLMTGESSTLLLLHNRLQQRSYPSRKRIGRQRCHGLWSSKDIVDAEFERYEEPNADEGIKNAVTPRAQNLFDLSISSEPDWDKLPVPFFRGDDYINTKLAFMVDLDGESYGIAIPYESAVIISIEGKDGSVTCISPESEDDIELMEAMAIQLQEHVGKDLVLKRTPKVLTVSGPLDKYTDDWEETVLPRSLTRDELMNDDDDVDLNDFLDFMRSELGDEEYEKTINESTDGLDPEFAALFDVPGFGENKFDDDVAYEKFKESALADPDAQMREMNELLGRKTTDDHVALKLISYKLESGNIFSLSKLIKPLAIVGRLVSNDSEEQRFELLSDEDEAVLIPKLEKTCQLDMQQATGRT